ncbi:MAG: amidohydrolase family protein [Tepidisphaerales bacterium]
MRRMRWALAAWLMCGLGVAWGHDSIPGPRQVRPVAVVGGTVHTVSGPVIEGGVVVFDAGRITAVGRAGEVAVPAGAEVIDASGKHVYPGLIDAYTDLGLTEIESIRATRDAQETGSVNPNVRVEVAVNPDSEQIPVARANGVLLTITSPRGGLVSGQSACLRMDGWTWEEMLVRGGVGMNMSWPSVSRPGGRTGAAAAAAAGATGSGPETTADPLRAVRQLIADARAYLAARQADPNFPSDLRLEAMRGVVEGRVPMVVSADGAETIASAVAFAVSEKLRLVIVGGYEAERVAPLLREHGVAVVINGVHRNPNRRIEPYDAPFTLAARLRDAGVPFAITGNRAAAFSRNLPYHAATAAAFGLTRAEALRAITLSPAEIFGVADVVGSLDVGKEATLFIADGDILDTESLVTHAWTQGRSVDLTSRHTRLWQKYQEKYRQLAR